MRAQLEPNAPGRDFRVVGLPEDQPSIPNAEKKQRQRFGRLSTREHFAEELRGAD